MKTLPTLLSWFIVFGIAIGPNWLNGQTIQSFTFSITTIYLPSGGLISEEYSRFNNLIITTVISKENWASVPSNSNYIIPGDRIERVINVIDSLSKLEIFTFIVDTTVKSAMKKAIYKKRVYGITDWDIECFFNQGDTVRLDLNRLKDTFDPPEIMDGIGIQFDLDFKRVYGDTIRHSFHANIYDEMSRDNIKYWLIFYLALRNENVFTTVEILNTYLGNERLKDALFLFIVHRLE